MTDPANSEMAWETVDRETVAALVESNGATASLDTFNASASRARELATRLVELSVEGRIPPLQKTSAEFCDWAAENGARRLENALIELDRVLTSPRRGEAILHAQALTRFIARHVDDDIKAVKMAITGKG